MKRALKNAGSTPVNNPGSFLNHLQTTITANKLILSGDVVVIGVSGGPDSTALVHALHNLRHPVGFRIVVAHFNHRIRRESIQDEKFVARMAKELGLEYVCKRASQRPPKTGSLEDWARGQRLGFLTRVATRYRAQAVALAHTADDLAETVMMRVLRGSGLMGLRGMSQSGILYGVRFVRPFLSLTKVQVLDYLKEHRLKFCKDKTNAKTDFFRNKIRLKLLPLLNKEYNANVRKALGHLSRSAADDYDFLYRAALEIWPHVFKSSPNTKFSVALDVDKLQRIHPAIRRIIVRMAFERLKGDLNQLTFDHVYAIENLMLRPSGGIDLPGSVIVKIENDRLCFSRRKI